jgi:hypothetical protein
MAIPHDHLIRLQLLGLLKEAPNGTLHCNDVYRLLAAAFPCLTKEELTVPYANSVSKWANRVQFARLHLVLFGYIEPPYLSGRGYWTISKVGRAYIQRLQREAEEALRELGGGS